MSKERVIFFDGVCPICNGFVNFISKLDKKRIFKYSSLQSQTAEKLLSRADLNLDTVVYREDGENFTRSTAVLRILFQIGGFWTLLALIFSICPSFLRDQIYNLVARNRYRIFGKYESCPIPTAEERAYFLE